MSATTAMTTSPTRSICSTSRWRGNSYLGHARAMPVVLVFDILPRLLLAVVLSLILPI